MVINFEELHPNERAELERNIFFSTLEQLKGWARSNSLWPMTFGLACCAIEMMGVGSHAHQLKNLHYPQVSKNVILSKKLA
ncbi:hypothetical protein ABE16_16395, partial [Bacillus thuringiensis]|nr:hypothetical protein [Bacillus thuringiensis]